MKVCIDPGHGMSNRKPGLYDPGATHMENGYTYHEASIALRYALALKDVFRARGTHVFLTRDDETDHTPVGQRAMMAQAAGCNAFISLHLNDHDDDLANGMEVLYRDQADSALAESLLKALSEVSGIKRRKIVQRDDLAVLRFTGVAVLIELGFIANDYDRARLLNAQIREAVTHKIADVVTEYVAA